MFKFVVIKTKENNQELMYIGESKEDAIAKGKEIAKATPRSVGLITVERHEVTEDGQLTGCRMEIFEGWPYGYQG